MKQQVFNPYLPSWEYVPDGEPHIFEDRLYVFGSHDRFNGTTFCMNDYVCWSAPVDDLSDWTLSGTIYRKSQDPYAKPDSIMQAPDVIRGYDGRFYLYYALGLMPFVSVAVSDKPDGPYEYYGVVRRKDGSPAGMGKNDVFMFDPGLFMDNDGKCYLYCGFGPEETGFFETVCKKYRMDGAYVYELAEDMLTIQAEPMRIVPKVGLAEGTGFAGHEFFEASSMRKIHGRYYFIYSSVLGHELCYAVSDYPDRDFTYGGILVSIGDIGLGGRTQPLNYLGNTHGSLVCVKGQWYIFYHRQTNRQQFSRQGCAEKIVLDEAGHFHQAEVTSCGLNNGPLWGEGTYPACIACHLWSGNGAMTYRHLNTPEAETHPYFTQTGTDREQDPDQYIANMHDGATAGYKYFRLDALWGIRIELSGTGQGEMLVRTKPNGDILCRIPVVLNGSPQYFHASCTPVTGVHALYFTWSGRGMVNFHTFELSQSRPSQPAVHITERNWQETEGQLLKGHGGNP